MSTTEKRRKRHKSGAKRMRAILLTLVLLIALGLGAGAGVVVAIVSNTPQFSGSNLKFYESSEIYDDQNHLVTKVYGMENRTIVPYNKLPKDLINAVVAVEDKRFWKHHGIDPYNLLAAVWDNLKKMGKGRGGSTITQQLAKNAFLTPERSIKRKLQEMWIAIQLERKYTKEEILEMYLNGPLPYSHQAFGVEAASQVYFGKHVWELNLAQSAMLAGIPNAPTLYSPYLNYENAKKRQAVVLDAMVENHYITKEQAEEAKKADLQLVGLDRVKQTSASQQYPGGYFTDYVIEVTRDILMKQFGLDEQTALNQIYQNGLKIYTTMDSKLQKKAEEVMANPENHPQSDRDRYGDLPQGALAVVQPGTGYVKALVGGWEHKATFGLNRAVDDPHQPGSAIKPIAVYAPAMEAGLTPATVFDDVPMQYPGIKGVWPENYDLKFRGLTTIREGIQWSINTVAVRTLETIGVERGVRMAKELGLNHIVSRTGNSPELLKYIAQRADYQAMLKNNPNLTPEEWARRYNDDHLPLALGGVSIGVTPLEMASAYAAFSNKGIYVAPTVVVKITDRNGKVIYENKPVKRKAMSEETAYLMADMLKTVIKSGTGTRANIGRPAGGKTGTTDSKNTAWFVGMTPDYAAAVMIGFDRDRESPMKNVFGGTYPAAIWKQVMLAAHEGLPVRDFERPAKIVGPIEIDTKSGLLATDLSRQAGHVRAEIFKKGTEPIQLDNLHTTATVHKVNGVYYLATEFCPPNEVETRVFFTRPTPYVPPEAEVNLANAQHRAIRYPADYNEQLPFEYCPLHGGYQPPDIPVNQENGQIYFPPPPDLNNSPSAPPLDHQTPADSAGKRNKPEKN